MVSGTIAILIGVLAALRLPELPQAFIYPSGLAWIAAIALTLSVVRHSTGRLILLAVLGFCWAVLRASLLLAPGLPRVLEGQDVTIDGRVVGLTTTDPLRTRFQFDIVHLSRTGQSYPSPGRVSLSWYKDPPSLAPGQRCQLTVRLKRPHGTSNPAGFDYERWLFQNGIRAVGYVRVASTNACRPGLSPTISSFRQRVRQRFTAVLGDKPTTGMLIALAIGDRSLITDQQWQVLRNTGTAHLVAISGLHVGMIAALVFWLVRRLWRWPALLRRIPSPSAAAGAGLIAALIYAELAGFSVPTQRALVMIAVAMATILWRRKMTARYSLAAAMIAVLVLDPMAPLSSGFWLSFSAVAVIALAMSGRLCARGLWWRWGRVQFAVLIGLLPLMSWDFGQIAWISPLANIAIIPWVGFLVVPLTLAAVPLSTVSPGVAEVILHLATAALEPAWHFLLLLSRGFPATTLPPAPLWMVLAAAVGVVMLLVPRGVPVRAVGLAWLLPLFFVKAQAPLPGQARITLLDVGEGLSAVVRTANHCLVFDAGARYRTGFDLGEAVVAPFVHRAGSNRIDTLVVSHGDLDHVGGVRYLLTHLTVNRILTGEPGAIPEAGAQPCRRGDSWEWDGIRFTMLHPEKLRDDNNGSCVLRVAAGPHALLLTGDIEAPAERELVDSESEALDVDVLVAPHHGSKTSSTDTFVRAVMPAVVLFPVGYRNRYGFPHSAVVARYLNAGAELWGTARDGTLTVRLDPREPVQIVPNRPKVQRFWHSRVHTLGGWSAL